MSRARDDLLLQVSRQLGIVGGVSGDPHGEVPVLVGVLARGPQVRFVQDIELHVADLQANEPAEELGKGFQSARVRKHLGREFQVQQGSVAAELRIDPSD